MASHDPAGAPKRHADSGGNRHVILCDVSSSMASSAGTDRGSRIFRGTATGSDLGTYPTGVCLRGHSHGLPQELPPPLGGTALHLGLDEAAKLNPAATLVVTDGEPNEARLAVAAAGRLRGRIDVIYCGDTSDLEAIGFCRLLARMGKGQCGSTTGTVWSGISGTMRLMLAGPK